MSQGALRRCLRLEISQKRGGNYWLLVSWVLQGLVAAASDNSICGAGKQELLRRGRWGKVCVD